MTEPGLAARIEVLKRLQDHLQTLEGDLHFEQDGGTILYIVDFAALWAYIWKQCQGVVLCLPEEAQERVYARRQVALSLLFGGRIKNLLLIPPYNEELCDEIQALDNKARVADFDVAQLQRLKSFIKASPEFRRFREMRPAASLEIDDSEQGKKERENLKKAVVELGKNFFPELFTIIHCEKVDVLSSLRRVFDQQIMVHADTVIQSMEDFGNDASIDCMLRWKKKIARKRKREKAFANVIDALGCAYLEIADARLQERDENQRAVFVSASESVIVPLREHPFYSKVTGLRRNPVRDLDFFWVRSVQPDLESVRQSLDLVVKLLRIYDSPAYSGQADTMNDWRQAENLFLLTDVHLLEYPDTVSAKVEEDFLLWLDAMHHASSQSGTMLESQRKQLFDGFRQKISQIDRLLPTRSSIIPILEIEVEARRAFLKGLSDEADIAVELFDNAVVAWAKRVGTEQSENSSTRLREEILDWPSHRTNAGSWLLLAAYLLASEEKYDAALSELLKGLPKIAGRERKELLYLAAMIERKLFKPGEALEHILSALAVDGEDARFRVECGKIYWLKWQTEREEQKSTPPQDLETAIEHLEAGRLKAAAAPHHEHLLAQAENALAFVHCELALLHYPKKVDYQEIAAAEAHLKNLKEQASNARWLGRYDDTAGWILYAKAVASKDASPGQRKMWLTDAENHMKRALQRETSSIGRQRLVRDHLIKIRQALARGPR